MKEDKENKKMTWYEFVWSIEGYKVVSISLTILSYMSFISITGYPFSWGWFFFYFFIFPHTIESQHSRYMRQKNEDLKYWE